MSSTVLSNMDLLKLKQKIAQIEQMKSSEGKTAFISCYVPAKMSQINLAKTHLNRELGSASFIKDKNTSKAVREGLSAILQRLKDSALPKHGHVYFVGHDEAGKLFVKTVQPLKPIENRVYICDSKFCVSPLQAQVDEASCETQRGFIIVDGNGALFATMRGKVPVIRHQFSVDLPKKHRKGGQSAGRFFRCRS